MDWAVFVVFLLSITSLKCEIITVADDINLEEATPTPNIINTTDNNKEPELPTITEEIINSTSETNQSSGDIDVYYGFQALPVVVKFLGEDGKFYWYFAREGVEEIKKNFPHYGYNNQYWGPQNNFPYNYGGSRICSNPLQNCHPNSQGADILSQVSNRYPLNPSNHYHISQNGLDTSPFDTHIPYVPYPWITPKPSDNWFNPFLYNHQGFSSPLMENPSLNPYFSNPFTGFNPYSEFNQLIPYFSNPYTGFNPYSEFNPLNPYLSNPYTGINPFNPYLSNPYTGFNPYSEFNPYLSNVLPQMNPFSNLPFSNHYSGLNPFLNSYFSNILSQMNLNERYPNPTMNYFNSFNPFFNHFPDFYPFLNPFLGFDGEYPFSHPLQNTFNPYYRTSMVKDSPYNHASPRYDSLNYFKPSYVDSPFTRSEYPLYMIPSNMNKFHKSDYMDPDSLNKDQFYTSDPINPPNLNSPNHPNQFYRKIPFFQPTYLRSPNPFMSYNPTLFCKYPSNRPFLTTSYDYINRLPVDPIYRLFFKVLITSLANLYHRNGYIDEPVYSYPYYYSI